MDRRDDEQEAVFIWRPIRKQGTAAVPSSADCPVSRVPSMIIRWADDTQWEQRIHAFK